jgi:protein subunit release factor B
MSLPSHILAKLAAVGVSPEDVEERFVRGSGPGGQKINKTSSTVWLRHRSTGIEVRCQRERSQAVNRLAAWEELASRLEARRAGAVAGAISDREAARRRVRQKSRNQKVKMIEIKKIRAVHKARRGRVSDDW